MCGICVCPWYLDFIVSVATVRILNERLLSVRRGAKRERVVQEMSFGGMQEEMVGFCASLLALILGFYDRASGCYPHRVCYSLSHTHTQDCKPQRSKQTLDRLKIASALFPGCHVGANWCPNNPGLFPIGSTFRNPADNLRPDSSSRDTRKQIMVLR